MFTQVEIMLYVKDPEKCAKFWTDQVGFALKEEGMGPDQTKSYLLAPNDKADASLRLFDKEAIAKYSPEVDLATPSLLFSCADVKSVRQQLLDKGVTVAEVVEMGDMETCNFADPEGHYFAFKSHKA
ncbi:bleomycin resistance protein [Lactobacillus nasalidis]|uniref:Bleomycin resistance protein n=1 Tax=Lactobacillus nasalidis TaxID=2797258 RepID=A0ABQ3W7G9_9LACO|nr:VOC family protein [Lactobacillus nasalidis]GHV97177.1 bleomycin resistance protein [Lactobacillus nasalidis]GHV98934.1 bleomycin resistance protein [Lactobacillus nasalidis]GHW00842.1 bleomycin resistance protein [Lactobacillus nasalidis]